MKKKTWKTALLLVAVLLILGGFLSSLSRLEAGQREEGRAQLEEALRRTAVACYASEGIYPPDVAYMQEHYGIRIDERHYAVIYEIQASNLMPEITVLEID